ncbi:Inositol-1-monophosphatase [Anaerohalosphaera lusitana]|uniref:Inositol-1-monophosphatase n=1 Tax=Anaerohalosphaera lusitana TaxID=1936003 RepID=A0A1U9NN35_9BACT|nr:inositol monophosphatase family protein [Anaerohalosphaera lusitana]AQT69319.1 Inositol-1-monophosphatase [Anaerohalosphaera lusitana]
MREFLKNIMIEAGRVALEQKQRLGEVKVDRKSEKDLVTEADVAVEEYLVGQIKERYPDHAIVGEETGEHEGGEYRWIIDPIDGTTSFVHDQPFFSTSVAVEKDGETVLGAVNAPVLGELFMAEKGKGATLNGEAIHVSDRERLIDSVLGTGFACVRQNLEHNNLPYFAEIVTRIRGVRRYGSAAMDLSYVACGRLDGFWELNLQIYDVAAGVLIVQEAGGVVSDFAGGEEGRPFETLATNGRIHEALSRELMEVQMRPGD